jgi:hypothetical protein
MVFYLNVPLKDYRVFLVFVGLAFFGCVRVSVDVALETLTSMAL